MALFGKKMPTLVDPTFIDMRLAENQIPPETLGALTKMGILFLQPEKLSQWAISTLLMHDDKDVTILPQDAGVDEFKRKKTLSQIQIPNDLKNALLGNGDPENLLLKFNTWERTVMKVLSFPDGSDKAGLLSHFADEAGVEEMDFPALLVPDYTGKDGAPGEVFHLYVLLPQPFNGLDYIVFGKCAPLAQPILGGVEKSLQETGELVNRGKAIPGLVKTIAGTEGRRYRFYLPREIVEATGWWAEEVEGIPSELPYKSN